MRLSKNDITKYFVLIFLLVLFILAHNYYRKQDMIEIRNLNYKIHSLPLTGAARYNPNTILSEIKDRYDKKLLYLVNEYRPDNSISTWEMIGQSSTLWIFSKIIYKLTIVESTETDTERGPLPLMIYLTSISSRSGTLLPVIYFTIIAFAFFTFGKESFPHLFNTEPSPLVRPRRLSYIIPVLKILLILAVVILIVTSYNFGEISYSPA